MKQLMLKEQEKLLNLLEDNDLNALSAFFLKHPNCDLNFQDKYGNTPLYIAVDDGNAQIVEMLLSHGADANALDAEGTTILQTACNTGNIENIRLLLSHGANPNIVDENMNWTPLCYAIDNDRLDIAELLLKHNAKVNVTGADNETPETLLLHCKEKDPEADISSLYQKIRAKMKEEGCFSRAEKEELCVLTLNGRITDLEQVLQQYVGYDLNFRNEYGLSPLAVAVASKNETRAKMLLEYGADINYPNYKGWTVFHQAIIEKNVQMLDFLLENGADVNAKIDNDMTLLHFATAGGNRNLVDYLLKHKADISLLDARGCNALHVAIGMEKWDIAKILIEKGADVTAKTGKNETPLDLLKLCKSQNPTSQKVEELEKLLESKMQKVPALKSSFQITKLAKKETTAKTGTLQRLNEGQKNTAFSLNAVSENLTRAGDINTADTNQEKLSQPHHSLKR